MSTQYLGDKPNEGAIRIVTSLNGEHGDIIVSQHTIGFDNEIIKKSDVGHEHNYKDSAITGGSASSWWERSPKSSNTGSFGRVSNSGNAASVGASTSYGVAFGFCV